MGIPPPHLKAGVERIIWGGSMAGSFSVKNAYGKIKEGSWKPKEDAWKIPWKFRGPQKLIGDVFSGLSFGVSGRIVTSLYFKIYGSVRVEDDSAVAGKVVKGRNREWIIGYNRFLGNCSVFEAKLCGILDGLNTLIDHGLDNVMIQTDSLEAVMTIWESSIGGSNTALIRRILQLLSQFSH
ncbi:hypothetical protein Gogos_000918 [Gossypium gossypioides]|uniref:RNase H type-1 domain-containing protein n=1 Tax=Gossypium gossypioides TaxID=34282 RepID=A0A7J9CUH5_GOSGO|nr:hypothetical protein [Gossypium gossypioides]